MYVPIPTVLGAKDRSVRHARARTVSPATKVNAEVRLVAISSASQVPIQTKTKTKMKMMTMRMKLITTVDWAGILQMIPGTGATTTALD